MTDTPYQQTDAYTYLRDVLSQYGLTDLNSWAWSELQSGSSADAIMLDMRNQPAFKARFPGIDARVARGLPAISPADYLAAESSYRRTLRENGIDTTTLGPTDYLALFTQDISPAELSDRMQTYFTVTHALGNNLRDAFAAHAGLTNISDKDLYGMVSGTDTRLIDQYSKATGHPPPSVAEIQDAFKRAQSDVKSLFAPSGGPTSAQGQMPGVTGQEAEQAI